MRARANGIEIEYETFGDPAASPLLLIMGLGAQMILWDEDFCRRLAGHGHYVIRFDNRDVGLSTKLADRGTPDVNEMMRARARGEQPRAPYTLEDMADDAAGLLDALRLPAAHVAGASMGGMIAQTLALRHPERVRSLTSIMSHTGNPELPSPTPEAMRVLMTPAPPDREGNVERALETARVVRGGGYPLDEARLRERAARAYDRCFHPAGVARQLAAITAAGDRREKLRGLRVPTLVIHGDADPLVPVEGGIDTHEAVPGSALLRIEGMGHELPEGAWPLIIDALSEHVRKAEETVRSATA